VPKRGRPSIFPGKVKKTANMKKGYLTERGRKAFDKRQSELSERAGFPVSEADTIEAAMLGEAATEAAIKKLG
jgi:hypothetical protein